MRQPEDVLRGGVATRSFSIDVLSLLSEWRSQAKPGD